MDFVKCSICNNWHWDNRECDPIFYCQIPDYHGDEWGTIRATDHQEAAEKYCNHFDSENDNTIIRNGELNEIRIKDETGKIKVLKIDAFWEPVYNASEIK